MTTSTEQRQPPGPTTYAPGGRPPQFGYTANTGPVVLGLIFVSLTGVLLALAFSGVVAALVVGAFFGVVMLLLVIRDRYHRNGIERIANRIGFWRTRRRGGHVLSQGPYGQVGYGDYRLPGLLADSTLEDWEDSYGRRFSVLHVPGDNSSAVTLQADPNGGDLLDHDEIEQMVGNFGVWLGGLGSEADLIGAAVTVENLPDDGTGLQREVQASTRADAHPLASGVLAEIVRSYPTGASKLRAYVALTFNRGNRKPEDVGRELRTRMPGLTAALTGTGAGAVRPASADKLCEIARTAYDPASARQFTAARATGHPLRIPWTEAGPMHGEEARAHYATDSALHRTYVLAEPPRGLVTDQILARLLSPHPDIEHKRVTMLYRGLRPEATARIVDSDVRNSETAVRNAPKSARAKARQKAAERTAAEEAQGAGLVMYSMLITVTVTDPTKLDEACTTLENLAAACRLTVRPLYGGQAMGFAACLPFGVITSRHLRLPADFRAGM